MSDKGVPPEIMTALAGGAGAPLPVDPQAAATSAIAQDGLAAWTRVQQLNGARPEGSDMKALIMYVLTEGMAAPEAPDIAAYLQAHGVALPGVGPDAGGDGPPMLQPPQGQ